jgi:hypothetical protein
MQEFIGAFLSAVSYFITTYFLYRIFGGRRTIPLIFLAVIFLNGMLSFVGAIVYQLGFQVILLSFMTEVLPVLVASFFFYTVTGVRPMLRIRFRRKIKELPMDIQTKKQTIIIIFGLMGMSLVIGVLGFLFSEGLTEILSFVMSGILILFAIILFFKVRHITEESVILFVGKEKELVYAYKIQPDKTKVLVSDFYRNPMFIVDKIGEVDLINPMKQVEKHHLYWIATSSAVDMSGEALKQLKDVPYREHLGRFEKYHFKHMIFKIGTHRQVEFVKETIIR